MISASSLNISLKAYLCHVLKQHAERLPFHNYTQQTDDVGMAQISHKFYFTSEVSLSLRSGILLQCFDGY